MKLTLFVDGGAINNVGITKGINAYSYVILDDNETILYHDTKSEAIPSTNNRVEILALLHGLHKCLDHVGVTEIVATSDSQLTINTFTKWLYNWQRKGLINKRANPDLLLQMVELQKRLKDHGAKFTFNWCRGHDGNKWNEFVDRACTKLLNEQKNKLVTESRLKLTQKPILNQLTFDDNIQFTEFFDNLVSGIKTANTLKPKERDLMAHYITVSKPNIQKYYIANSKYLE